MSFWINNAVRRPGYRIQEERGSIRKKGRNRKKGGQVQLEKKEDNVLGERPPHRFEASWE